MDLATLSRGFLSLRYKTQEKRALAVCLSYCLMDFFDADLSSKRIYYLLGSTKAPCSLVQSETLYLLFASDLPTTSNCYIFQVGYPTLLSFAKLLLEIEFSQSIDLYISPVYNKTNKGTWAELVNIVDRLEEERNNSYLQAVRGCLIIYRQISGALRQDDGDNQDAELIIRKELYQEVVKKLEAALLESTPRARNKRQRSESLEPSYCSQSPADIKVKQRDSSRGHKDDDGSWNPASWDKPAPASWDKPAAASWDKTEPASWEKAGLFTRPKFKKKRLPSREIETTRSDRGGLFDDSTPNAYAPDV